MSEYITAIVDDGEDFEALFSNIFQGIVNANIAFLKEVGETPAYIAVSPDVVKDVPAARATRVHGLKIMVWHSSNCEGLLRVLSETEAKRFGYKAK